MYADGLPEACRKYSCRADGRADGPAGRGRLAGAGRGDRCQCNHLGRAAVLIGPAGHREELEARGLTVVSSGRDLEVFKGVGLPVDISNEYDLPSRHGYLGVGHTRLATESAVTTDGSHPLDP